MKTLLINLLIILIIATLRNSANAQVIPDSLRTNWSHTGYAGTIPSSSLIINVKDFGAFGDSMHNDYAAVMNAVNSSANLRIIFFPAGNYLFKSTLNLPANVILRGEGSSTNLLFDLSQYGAAKDAIKISRDQTKSYTSVSNGFLKDDSVITVASASGFNKDNYAEIIENNGDWDADKSHAYVGQIVKITAVSGKTLQFTPALRLNFIDSLQPRIRPVTPIENVGIECLKITRLDSQETTNSANNISFIYANNCWVTGVESNFCQTSHVSLSSCTHITVSGCYFHDGFNYGGGGAAYGMYLHNHTGDCKIENSIFTRLRHSMLVIDGPNGNVFGYNYSFDTRSTTEVPPDAIGDIALHGHYAFANLYEGNIVQNIFADDFWGASGPYNTIFRNRAELYGIVIFDQYNYPVKTNQQNIVGNEVTNTDSSKGNYLLAGSNHFTFANNIKDSIEPQNTGTLNDTSYYLKSQPYFWNIAASWPSIGIPNALNSGSNPAKERYLSGATLTSCLKENAALSIIATADSIACSGSTTIINVTASGGVMPYWYSIDGINFQTQNTFNKTAGSYLVTVVDSNADTVRTTISFSQPVAIKASLKKVNVLCNGDSTGSITITASGGVKPYLFQLNNGTYQSSNVFSNLKARAYIVSVKDARNCILQLPSTNIAQSSAISISVAKANVSCKNAANGSITITASGGLKPYQYQLNTGGFQSNNIFSGLAAGTYTVYVKDANNCVVSKANIKISNSTATCKEVSFSQAENNSNKNFSATVFPNPFKTSFKLVINSSNKSRVQVKLVDMYGKEVYKINGTADNIYTLGASIVPGIYLVEVMQNNNLQTLKIIKQ